MAYIKLRTGIHKVFREKASFNEKGTAFRSTTSDGRYHFTKGKRRISEKRR